MPSLAHSPCSALKGGLKAAYSVVTQLIPSLSYVAESYLETPEGRAEAERAKREGSRAYMRAKDVVLRPGVAGGLAGLSKLPFCNCTTLMLILYSQSTSVSLEPSDTLDIRTGTGHGTSEPVVTLLAVS